MSQDLDPPRSAKERGADPATRFGFLHDVPEPLFVFNAAAQLCAANATARELLGQEARVGLDALQSALDPQGELRTRLLAYDRNGPLESRFRLQARDRRGQALPLEARIGRAASAPANLVVAVRDCRDWLKTEHELQRRLAFERLITGAAAELVRSENERLDGAVVEALGLVGGFFKVDRAYLFRIDETAQSQSNTHEWVARGISTEAHNLQDVPLTTFPWLLEQLRADRVVSVAEVALLPPEAANERAEFEREGIQSILIVPLWRGASLDGFVGFDAVRERADWGEDFVIGLRLLAQILSSTLAARELAQQLRELAFHDSLTGLANRKMLEQRLGGVLRRARDRQDGVLLGLMDLDDFKSINDRHGHAVGDQVLREIGRRLQLAVREGDTVARLGGDEFVLVVENVDADSPAELAQRLRNSCATPVQADDLALSVGFSLGLAYARDAGESLDTLLRRADAAMYRAKAEGKNGWVLDPGDGGEAG